MDLDYYLWKNKITQRVFGKVIDMSESSLSHVVSRKGTPRLLTAMKIVQATKGDVTFVELLSDGDREKLLIRADPTQKTKETQTAGK